MEWLDINDPPKLPKALSIGLWRQATLLQPLNPVAHLRLGEVLVDMSRHAEAIVALETSRHLDPTGFRRHDSLAECLVTLDRPVEALDAAEEGLAERPDHARLHYLRGVILQTLGRGGEAKTAFHTALTHSPSLPQAAERLFNEAAGEPDAGRLLAVCDSLPDCYAMGTVGRGWRALGLSRLGRRDEAMALIDIDRHVMQLPFEPPAEFGGLERFNGMLAAEIESSPDLHRQIGCSYRRTESLNVSSARAYPVLVRFIREAVETFIADWAGHGLASRPEQARLWTAGDILLGNERHKAHLHKFGVVSGVYHVMVPEALGTAGNLRMGVVDDETEGHQPCWGTRDLPAVAGTLTLFASQVFHAVVPTATLQPRIAVALDVNVPIPA